MTGQGPTKESSDGGSLPTRNCSRAGEPKTTAEEIFDHINGKPTVERVLLEGRSRDAGSTDAKEKDVTVTTTGRKICLVGTLFTIPFVICTIYM